MTKEKLKIANELLAEIESVERDIAFLKLPQYKGISEGLRQTALKALQSLLPYLKREFNQL